MLMNQGTPKPTLSLVDGVAIIVGLVIGAGIFRLPSVVAGILGREDLILLVWFCGGVVSLLGALCYAELATSYPSAGGEYHFLTLAYGANVGFMFAWARMTVIQSGSIALFAFVFGDYASQIISLGAYSSAIYAGAIIIALTGLNLAGMRQTTAFQNVMFAATMVGLAILVIAGFTAPPAETATAAAQQPAATAAAFGSGMLLVLLTFGGWNEAAYLSAEIRDRPRNMVRALLYSIGLITVIYLAANIAYVRVLGTAGVAASDAVASDVMRAIFGAPGAVVMTVIVLVVVLDNTNITIFTGARSNYALGQDFPLFRFLNRWDPVRGVPTAGVMMQGGIALAIVLVAAFARQGVQTVVDYLQPVFWLFFLLTGVSLFILRHRATPAEGAFRVPLYPVIPALFCMTGAFMLYSSVSFTGGGALWGLAVLALGLPVLVLARRSRDRRLTATSPDTTG